MHVSTDKYEFGVQLEGILIFLGDVRYDVAKDQLSLTNISHVMRTKLDLLNKLRAQQGQLFNRSLLCFLAVAAIGVLGYQQLVRYLNLRRSVEQRSRQKGLKPLDQAVLLKDEDFKCIVCYDRPKNAILKNCMHLCLCTVCEAKFQKKVCPICRNPYSEIVEIFVA